MKLKKIAALLAVAGLSTSAFATNGYFSHGYGIKAKGMAGVGIALPQDAMAAATNPAGITAVGDRLDVGVDYFMPRRSTEIAFGFTPPDGNYDGNGAKNFLIPEFGYNRMLGKDMAVGIAVYGNGGMNTKYKGGVPIINPTADVGVNLEQLFVAPTFAMNVNKDHSLGVSLVYGYQRFAADGLQAFGVTTGGANLGYDTSDGWGLRLGWTGKITDTITLGATYATKMKMSKFDKYKGLFAEQGDFDIPENYGIGIAVKATPQLTVAFDVQQINYSGVKAIANTGNVSPLTLGQDNGPGFGWRDMTVYKLGANYAFSKHLTLRAGYSTGRQPIPTNETFFNTLAPGVIESHLTLGGTWTLANKDELTVGYMHGFKNTVNGTGTTTGMNIKMYQNSLGIAYGMKFK